MRYPGQAIFLFNEEQEVINSFNTPTLAAKHLGVSMQYILLAIRRQSAVHARYYLSRDPTSSFTISNAHERNALHSREGFNSRSQYSDGYSNQAICDEMAAGFRLLFDPAFTFDHYLFGNLIPVAEQVESFSDEQRNKYKP